MLKRVYEDKELIHNLGNAQRFILAQADRYITPYFWALYALMDVRLVRTFSDAFKGILAHRNKDKSLILSELGGYITGLCHAPSGTKRLSHLFHCSKWTAQHIEDVQLQQSTAQVASWTAEGHRVLGFIDDSTIEKAESWLTEGLCAVYSSKAARLTRVKKGYYNQLKGRICVPGFEWTSLMIGGLAVVPMVGLMKWWTKRGTYADSHDNVFYKLIKQIAKHFEQNLTLVFDRGFANASTLDILFKWQQNFIIRWKSAHLLQGTDGKSKNTWLICHGKKGFDRRTVWDKERKRWLRVEIIYAPVHHPEWIDKSLTLVVVRHKSIKNRQPMYLLTNLEVDSIGIAWEIFKSYLQRWDVEQAFRFNKAELGIQAIRVLDFQTRLKIMALLTLVFDFLLRLWRNRQDTARLIIKKWCPRTDKRLDKAELPMYRLRAAITNALTLLVAELAKT